MALLTPTVGENEDLGRILNKNTADNVVMHLYNAAHTPAEGDTIASYTLETDPAAVTLTGANWTIADGTATYAQQTYTYSGTGTAYGYVVTNTAGTIVMWAEKFNNGPYEIPAGGGTIKITPSISLD